VSRSPVIDSLSAKREVRRGDSGKELVVFEDSFGGDIKEYRGAQSQKWGADIDLVACARLRNTRKVLNRTDIPE